MSKYDNIVCFNNILYLYKSKGMKIGEFENRIGASTGHFSRLVKEDGKIGAISSELLFNASNILGIPVDILGSVDITKLDATEVYILNFINRLSSDTENRKNKWEVYRKEELDRYEHVSTLVEIDDPFSNSWVYNSEYWDDRKYRVFLNDDVFGLQQESGIFLLSSVKVMKSENEFYDSYELYFKDYNEKYKEKICFSSKEQKEGINKSLEFLFKAVKNYMNLPKVEENVKLAIDSYMKKNS